MPKVKRSRKNTRSIPYAKGFRAPTAEQIQDAIGKDLLTKQLEPGDQGQFFPPIPACNSIDDWLAQYDEEGQTYSQFLEECPWLSTRKRKSVKQNFIESGPTLREKYPDGKIYLVPVGEFSSETSPKFEALQVYTKVFLGIPVIILPTIKLRFENNDIFWEPNEKKEKTNKRRSGRIIRLKLNSRFDEETRKHQICVDSALVNLRAMIPDDAICLIGLTMSDLYCDPTDLFVAGMAAGNHRVAIFSFTRYDPCLSFSTEFWYRIEENISIEGDERKRLILLRSCKLLVHEICHLLGIDHCIFYSCCMNGSGHLAEDFRQPMFMCPVDLRKLQCLVGFDIEQRYRELKDFFTAYNMREEADWLERRIQFITKST